MRNRFSMTEDIEVPIAHKRGGHGDSNTDAATGILKKGTEIR
jgi:hypothetical protein